MSILVRKKIIKECDGCATPSAPISTLNNVGGVGNPVPPSENNLGSGDNFGNVISTIATQTGPKFKLRRKKKS